MSRYGAGRQRRNVVRLTTGFVPLAAKNVTWTVIRWRPKAYLLGLTVKTNCVGPRTVVRNVLNLPSTLTRIRAIWRPLTRILNTRLTHRLGAVSAAAPLTAAGPAAIRGGAMSSFVTVHVLTSPTATVPAQSAEYDTA